jgi:hypothetical protein
VQALEGRSASRRKRVGQQNRSQALNRLNQSEWSLPRVVGRCSSTESTLGKGKGKGLADTELKIVMLESLKDFWLQGPRTAARASHNRRE